MNSPSRTFTRQAVSATKEYGIGTFCGEMQMSSGTTSNAWRLDTDKGRYIMRRLSGQPQAENEFRISEALKHQGVCPEILRTEAGVGWMHSEDGIYNVQRYVQPLPTKDVKKLDYHEINLQYIHGDLGSWNLVFGSDGMRVIDFGELRRGDPHFDLAALLTSMLDLSDQRVTEYLSSFIQGYSLHMNRYEPKLLAFHIRLWNVRGVAALLNQVGWSEKSARYVRKMLDQYEAFTALLAEEHKNLSKNE